MKARIRNSDSGTGNRLDRRRFLWASACAGVSAVAGIGLNGACSGADRVSRKQEQDRLDPDGVKTNLSAALAVPRTKWSMPGRYPGVVAEVSHPRATEGCKPNHANAEIVAAMLASGMKNLTGAKDERDAWSGFFNPTDRIGIKINPTGVKLLSNTHELLRAVIASLESIGVPKSNIIIWDHFEHEMIDADYTSEFYPGIECVGFSYCEFEDGKRIWKGEDRIDENVYYEFDIPGEYTNEKMAGMMMNTGTKSYFPSVLTQRFDKVINIPVLKNYQKMVTNCLKNLAYGVTSNCGRGHAIMNRYIAEVCAFPSVRDKTVLNIVDGFRSCYRGGPVGVARYIWDGNTIWVATDPVAADSTGWDFVFAKQVEVGEAESGELEGRKKENDFLARAENLGLGVYKGGTIDHHKVVLA